MSTLHKFSHGTEDPKLSGSFVFDCDRSFFDAKGGRAQMRYNRLKLFCDRDSNYFVIVSSFDAAIFEKERIFKIPSSNRNRSERSHIQPQVTGTRPAG